MNDKVIAVICAVAALAAWVCAQQFGKQAETAAAALTLSGQRSLQARQQVKDAADRLSELVQTEGDLTQEEVTRLKSEAEEQRIKLETEIARATEKADREEFEVRDLEKRVADRQAEVRELEEQVDKKTRTVVNTSSSSVEPPPVRVVNYPVMVEDRSDLQPMINRMAALRCREATSALYQKRLLTLLPMIRDGAPVDLTLPETKGNTALHYSCGIGSWSITRWLVEHGADVNAVTNKGKTPLDCVGSDNAQRIRALLISRGARHGTELIGGGWQSSSAGQTSMDIAAQNGDADAQNNLGLAYQYGNGKPQNYSEAARWYRHAAEQGHAAAQNNLGFCYHNGWGVPQDYSQAAYWYRLSAQQGNAWGQSNYGTCLEFGWGVPKNRSAAIEMYRRAAAQGHASAKKHLRRNGIAF